jgi:transposase-like protein
MKLEEQMYRLVEAYQRSGKSQKQFCNSAGIGLGKLNYWVSKYRAHQQPAAGFIKVEPLPAGQEQRLEIVYPNGVRLQATGADLSLVSQLIRLY